MSTAQPPRTGSEGRSRGLKLLGGRVISIFITILLGLVLYLVTVAVCGAVANALPGVDAFESPQMLVRAAFLAVVFAGMSLFLLNLTAVAPRGRRLRRIFARARILSLRLLRDVLGVLPRGNARHRGRRIAGAVGLGVLAGILTVYAGQALQLIPALIESVPSSDARFDAVAGSPAWVPPVFFAIYGAPPEELLYRGALLAVCAGVAALTTNRWIRGAVIFVALVVTSFVFGLGHIEWSLLNAVSATLSGFVYGAVAIATRSLWPAIIAHALHNVLIFIV